MSLSYKKILASVLVTTTVLATTLSMSGASADETVINLSRNKVGDMAATYSPTIKGLDNTLTDLIVSHGDLVKSMKGLQAVYDLLPVYDSLSNAYTTVSTIPNYLTYLNLMISQDANNMAMASRMIDGDGGSVEADLEVIPSEPAAAMDSAAELALALAISQNPQMSPMAYGQYLGLQQQFASMGIMTPNISSKQEYEMFIYPINVVPRSMQTGIKALTIGKESAQAAISNGAGSLYDGILMMRGFEALQEKAYKLAVDDLNVAQSRFDKGQLSEIDLMIAKNKLQIAQRNHSSMIRSVENMEMSLNVMLGQDVTAQLDLMTPVLDEKPLEEVEVYIASALEQRNEVLSSQNDIDGKLYEFGFIKEYYSKSSDDYKNAERDLGILYMNHEIILREVEVNVQKAYMNTLEKKQNLAIKKLAKEDSERSYEEFKLNMDLGFITGGTLDKLQTMVLSANNDYYVAYRDYMNAITSLKGASSIGPGFSDSADSQGGM